MKITASSHRVITVLLTGCLMLPSALWAQVEETPPAAAMVGDLIVARPIGLVMTVVGTAAFIVSLPFTLLAGNVNEAAQTLMIGPAQTTFMRCLGCTKTGYSYKDIEKNQQDDD